MVDVEFDFIVDGQERDDDPLFDPYELDMLFEHTRRQIRQDLQRKLGDLCCPQHGQPPRIKVTGTYNAEIEQMDIQYNIDTCCQVFLAQIVHVLNRVN